MQKYCLLFLMPKNTKLSFYMKGLAYSLSQFCMFYNMIKFDLLSRFAEIIRRILCFQEYRCLIQINTNCFMGFEVATYRIIRVWSSELSNNSDGSPIGKWTQSYEIGKYFFETQYSMYSVKYPIRGLTNYRIIRMETLPPTGQVNQII